MDTDNVGAIIPTGYPRCKYQILSMYCIDVFVEGVLGIELVFVLTVSVLVYVLQRCCQRTVFLKLSGVCFCQWIIILYIVYLLTIQAPLFLKYQGFIP